MFINLFHKKIATHACLCIIFLLKKKKMTMTLISKIRTTIKKVALPHELSSAYNQTNIDKHLALILHDI